MIVYVILKWGIDLLVYKIDDANLNVQFIEENINTDRITEKHIAILFFKNISLVY